MDKCCNECLQLIIHKLMNLNFAAKITINDLFRVLDHNQRSAGVER